MANNGRHPIMDIQAFLIASDDIVIVPNDKYTMVISDSVLFFITYITIVIICIIIIIPYTPDNVGG